MKTEEKAFEMAKKINDFFQQRCVIGVVGGTERNKEATDNQKEKALSPIDFCVVGDFGACNQFRHSWLPEVKIPVYNAIFDSSGKDIAKEIAGKNLYLSGGFIANKASALTMARVPPEKINEVTVGELIAQSTVPVTFDIAPLEIQLGDYGMSREAFRKGAGRNWILKVVNQEARYFIPTLNGYAQLEQEKVKRYLKAWIPAANGVDWPVDFGALAKVPYPTDYGLDVIGAWGCHKWGTFALNAAMMLAHEVPTIKTRVVGINETMSFLYDVVTGENLEYYEMIVAVLNRQIVSGQFTRELTLAPVGLFEVP